MQITGQLVLINTSVSLASISIKILKQRRPSLNAFRAIMATLVHYVKLITSVIGPVQISDLESFESVLECDQ